VRQAQAHGRRRVELLREEQQPERAGAPHLLHQPRRAAPPGRSAQPRVHKLDRGALRHDAQVGGGAELGAATDGRAVDGRDREERQVAQPVQGVGQQRRHQRPALRRVDGRPHGAQIRARAKVAALARDQQHAAAPPLL